MSHVAWKLTLTLEAPFLSQSSSYRRFGLDATLARDAAGTTVIVPGTLLTGKLLEAWKELRACCEPSAVEWERFEKAIKCLGAGCDATRHPDNPPFTPEGYMPSRKRLDISDLQLTASKQDNPSRARIRRNEELGSADEGALRIIEQPAASGARLHFSGVITLFAESAQASGAEANDIEYVQYVLQAGLAWIVQLGSSRSTGYGRVRGFELTRIEPAAVASDGATPESGQRPRLIDGCRIPFALTLDRPYVFAATQPAENLFEGTPEIPGAAIKGALAFAWKTLLGRPQEFPIDAAMDEARVQLGRHFDTLIFRHAFPSENGKRPILPLFSLATATSATGEPALFDLSLLERPALLLNRAPSFLPDWKGNQWDQVTKYLGLPGLERDLRVRTAMELGHAAEGQLFAYEMVVPREGVTWLGEIVLPEPLSGDEKRLVVQQLGDLLARIEQTLPGLGKTKARARLLWPDHGHEAAVGSRPGLAGGVHVIALQTHALLCNPEMLDESAGHERLFAAYAATWSEISDGTLSLVRFFARQRLAGGRYLWRRFQGRNAYHPWLLTEAGSVFVLRPNDGVASAAEEYLRRWQRYGLPLPAWAGDRYRRGDLHGDDWRTNPYIPPNGYGEMHLDLETHQALRPQRELREIGRQA